MRKAIIGILLAASAVIPAAALQAAPDDRAERIRQRLEQRSQARSERREQRSEVRVERREQRQEARVDRREERQEARVERRERPAFEPRQHRPEVREERRGGAFVEVARARARAEAEQRARVSAGERSRDDVRYDRRDRQADGGHREDRRDGREWQRDARRDQREWQRDARRDYRREHRQWDSGWRSDRRYDWYSYRNRYRNVYRVGRYYDPYGWGYRRFSIGIQLQPHFYGSRYRISNPWSYRLPDAGPGYEWVRYYDDVLLVDTWSGEVVDVIHDFFW